ncbi:hypothetical protein ACFSGI_15580 [Paenibacillus nicotianae]|uniref:LA2681-like HEPN domain-containing protein n=1 Tax=Paenibacillus nicotianae TaxID=1526551 RepID=A0ABW4V1B1_9BACL
MSIEKIKNLNWNKILKEFEIASDDGTFFNEFDERYTNKLLIENTYYSKETEIYFRIEITKYLLKKVSACNKEKYKKMHKGTPFYFLSMFYFLTKHYEKASFYLNATILEDRKNAAGIWKKYAAYLMFTLNTEFELQLGEEDFFVKSLKNKLIQELKEFNKNWDLNFNRFIQNFVENILAESENFLAKSSIITAIYSFILEKEEIEILVETRGEIGGSIEPIILHLFKGTLIVESLLKLHYDGKTLGEIYNDSKFKSKYNLYDIKISASSLNEVLDLKLKNKLKLSFTVAGKIRNTTAHKLAWDDIFDDIKNYNFLYNNIMNAIFYVIYTEYVKFKKSH